MVAILIMSGKFTALDLNKHGCNFDDVSKIGCSRPFLKVF